MAMGGESIGRAYIRILADGAGFEDDVRRQMRANEPQMRQSGEDASRAYWDGFRKELKKEGNQQTASDRLAKDLARGAGRYDAVGELYGDHLMGGLRERLEERFGDIGTRVFSNLKEQLDRGEIDFDGIRRSLRNIRPEIAKATDDITRDQKQRFDDLGRSIEDYGNTLIKTRNERRRLLQDLQTLGIQLPRNVTDTDNFRRRMGELGNILQPTGNRLARMRDTFVRSGETIGKFFGRGSRNDFLNFFGGFVSIAPRFIGSLTGGVRALAGFGQALKEAWQAGDTFRESLGNVVSGLGSLASAGLPGLVAAAGSVAIAMKIVMTLLPAFGAAIVGVSGLVLALAGSLAFALVGGLIAVGGALVPFAAALGVGALAMAQLQKKAKNKDFQKFTKGLREDWKALQEDTSEAVFGKQLTNLKSLSGVLDSLRPVIMPVAKALGGLLKSLGEATGTKEFTTLMKDLGKILGPMVTTLGQIGGNLAIGLLQVFRDASPLISQFLGWVLKLTEGLKNAGKGSDFTPLVQFLIDAGNSARIVGGLILDIVEAVGILLKAGKGTGDSLFASMAAKAQELVKWLTSPEGQKALKDMFAFAERLGESLGRVVGKVIEFVDALDTPTSRDMLIQIIDNIGTLIGWLTTAVGWWNSMNEAIIKAGSAVVTWIGGLPAWFAQLGSTITQAFNSWGQSAQGFLASIPGFFVGVWNQIITSISTFVGRGLVLFQQLPGQIVAAFQQLPANIATFVQQMIQPFVDLYNYLIGNSLIPDLVTGIVGWFARLPGMIAGALGDIAGRFVTWLAGVPQKIQSAVGLVAGAFSGLAGKAIARAGNIVSAFGKWVAGLPGKAKAIAVSVASGFTNLASKIIAKAGSLAARFASWVSSLAGKARSTAASIVSGFAGLAGKIISRAGSIAAKFASWVASLPGKAKTVAGNIANAFSGLATKIISKAGDIAAKFAAWGSKAVSKAGTVANNIVSKFSGLASDIVRAIGDIVPKIKMPTIKVPTVVAKLVIPKKAAGGIVSGAQVAMIGEAGPEAIVPLDRALSRVDPAVRALSAFAQGKTMSGSNSTTPSIGRNIDVGGITINTPTEDPRAVASEVVNRMTFAAYI